MSWALTASGLMAGGRFFASLPWWLARPLTPARAAVDLTVRLNFRDQRFLDRLRQDVFSQPGSVYHQLMRHAGCELGDLESSVRSVGIEATLTRLFQAGVWISVDEFKGRKPVVRGTLQFEAGPDRLRSPRAAYHLSGSSGGSRSSGTPVLFDLRFVRDCASNLANLLGAYGGADWVKADWESPGGGARFRLIKLNSFGQPPEAWFSQLDPNDPGLNRTTHWNTRAMRLAGRLVGRPFPAPVHAPLSSPEAAIQWAGSVLRRGRTPMIFTFPSSAVRLCLAAREAGFDISGMRFIVAGEPITEACVATIRDTGCVAIARYGSMETGAIGYACTKARVSDDLHLLADMHGLIQAGPDGEAVGLPEKALLITALHAHSPFLMLNTSMGDQGTLEDAHRCGCPLERLGWTRHLHSVRSFEKLTTLGATLLGGELIAVLEQVLPARFGGSPTNYQLVESETADGQPRLALRIDPKLGPLDEAEVLATFCRSVSGFSPMAANRIQLWRDAGTLSVERLAPEASRVGKILHIHRMSPATRGHAERLS